ncbi:dentin sialophosphoprotein-like [Phthorimaea operculella]|nr:dentin sialophosphoprotein-like [Phthorimaea operculella]
MAQTEDTELRDLVVEALEKNGSLAKIRALLRANVFLVFEDEGQNLKQNVSLDNILKVPEGAICLSIIHEFLEFCNLKNTLFVYMAESRQGTDYSYQGQSKLADKLGLPRKETTKEPILITLLKQAMKTSSQRKYFNQNDAHNLKNQDKQDENNFNDQNCTYIVHEDSNSSATSNSQSDNSSDEKNKLHLRLQLDNSDTDTSSDSARDKSSSEYIPSEHIIKTSETEQHTGTRFSQNLSPEVRHVKQSPIYGDKSNQANFLQELQIINNSSSDSTSYRDLKQYHHSEEKLLNTTGVPVTDTKAKDFPIPQPHLNISQGSDKTDTPQLTATKADSASDTISTEKNDNETTFKKNNNDVWKSDVDTAEYSNDFTSSPDNKNADITDNSPKSPPSNKDEDIKEAKNLSFESPRQSSQSSQSSVSISDVADLISERSTSFGKNHDNNSLNAKHTNNNLTKVLHKDRSKQSNDSADFSESPVPSLSNLSLDIHSD